MIFVLNVLLGALAFFVTQWVCRRLDVDAKVAFVLGLIAGVLVYLSNFAAGI